MPFTNLDSIIPTINEFIAHWTQVNTALGATPLTLPGAYAIAGLTADRDSLQTLLTAVTTADNGRQVAAADRDIRRAALRERMRQFRATVAGRLAGSVYVTALPRMPATNASQQAFLRVLDDMSNLWTRINAAPPAGFTPPLTLTGGYAIATFTADIAALRTAFSAVTKAALTWQASDAPDLANYSVRYHPGPRYRATEEQAVALVPSGVLSLATDFGLVASGSVAWFKVYVVLGTGNEKGSNAVKVIRP